MVFIIGGGLIIGLLQAGAVASISLPQVVRMTMAAYFENPTGARYESLAISLPVATQFHKPAGVFVTLSSNGKPRACWGSIYPQQKDAVKATVYATIGALTKEYRYPPIRKSEWAKLKTQVTLVRRIQAVDGPQEINPLKEGLMIRSGAKTGVILPGEARDAHYQLVQARLKANIQPNSSYQLYRIIADVYQ
jgi:AMMECR1 domain-containing protein